VVASAGVGDPDTVHQAGVSVRGRAITERRAGPLEAHMVSWPGKPPRVRRPMPREIIEEKT